MNISSSRRRLILVVLCLSTLVLVIDNMVLTVAIPPLAADLGADARDIQWILDSYILVFAGLLLTSGSLSDRFGRRRVMVIGLALFGAASLAAAYAADPVQLIAARVAMGVGGALIMPSTLSILITVFDERERRKALTAWSAVAMAGLIGGPVLGGALIAWFWWGAVFVINVPIAALAILAALRLMPESKGPWRKPDPLGMILSTSGMTALVWTIIELPGHGLTHPVTVAAAALAVIALAAFVLWELRCAHPMVPLGLFRDRTFSGGSLSLTLVQIGNGGLLLVLTQYLQYVLGLTPTQAGLAFIPMAVASLACNALGGRLGGRIGARPQIVTGLAVMAAGFGLLAATAPDRGLALPLVGLLLLGAGGGTAMPAAIAALMGRVPAEHAGVGSALNDTIQQMGAALGVAVLGTVLSAGYTAAMPATAAETARRSIADGLATARLTGDATLAQAAREAFTTAMSSAFAISAAGVLAAAVLALIVLRGGKEAEAPRPAASADVPERELATATHS
ncbi:MAG TPA: MFS transporter [Nonomuraea sp.]|nr:MFS transporter [Nonomuraea sp.]